MLYVWFCSLFPFEEFVMENESGRKILHRIDDEDDLN